MLGKTAATILRAMRARAESKPHMAQCGSHEIVALQIARDATGDATFDELIETASSGRVQFNNRILQLVRSGYKTLEQEPKKEWKVSATPDKLVSEEVVGESLPPGADPDWLKNALNDIGKPEDYPDDEDFESGAGTPQA